MSFKREVLPFRLTLSLLIVLVYAAIIASIGRHYSIPPPDQGLAAPMGIEGFILGKLGGAILIALLLWCFGLFDSELL